MRPFVALAGALAYVGVAAAALGLAAVNGSQSEPVLMLALAPYAVAGTVVLMRTRGNAVGWLLLSVGISAPLGFLAQEYAVYAYARPPVTPLGLAGAWMAAWLWLGMLAPMALVLFVFPDGRLPSRRWRLPFAAVLGVMTVAGVSFAFGTELSIERPPIANPLFVPALIPLYLFVESSFVPYLAAFGLGVASLAARYRSARADQRQQLKWVAATTAVMLAGLVVSDVVPDEALLDEVLWLGSVSALPVAIAISILRYGLYEIDVLINRTLVYGALTAAIGALYLGGVVASQAVLGPLTGGNEVAVAATTLFVVTLVQPLRRRIQSVVDRRFYRSRYDAQRTLDAFSARLRDQVDLGALEDELVTVVDRTVRPTHASVWLRSGRPGTVP